MKKLLLMTMAVIMMFASIGVFAADEDVVTKRTALAQLGDMGIMEGIGPYDTVTRAEMAKIVTQTLKMENIPMKSSFVDVSDGEACAGEIGTVQSLGIMQGCGDDIFAPNREITYCEVIKVVVTMLGYEPLALHKGGFPGGYMEVAESLGIDSDFDVYNGVMTKNDIAEILIDAIEIPLMEQMSYGDAVEYKKTEETIKTKYLNIQ